MGQQQEQEAQQDNPFGMLLQLLPVILMMALSFFGMPDTGSGVGGVKGHTGGSQYFVTECTNQEAYKKDLIKFSQKGGLSEEERRRRLQKANEFETSRCIELEDIFS